jgi:hypothetical protein
MGDADGCNAAALIDLGYGRRVEVANAVPQEIPRRRLDEVHLLTNGERGSVEIPLMPGLTALSFFLYLPVISRSVVHCRPLGFTYCRSSSQIKQRSGAAPLSEYCVPQVMQM